MKPILTYRVIFVLGLLLSACGSVSPTLVETHEADAIVLRVGALNDDYWLNPEDPGRVTVGMGSVNTNIFDTLIRMDPNFQLHPMLAERWEYLEDSGAWRFHLRQDVIFHNGQPFTAKAMVETMNRIALGEYSNVLNIDANSTTAVDEYTVDIRPLAPDLQLPGRITHPIFGIRAPDSDPFMGEHVGTGPFKLVEYVEDDHISVEKNVDYWGATPQVDQIEFHFMSDPDTRVAALQAQEVDIIYSVPLEAAEHLNNVGHVRALPATVGAYQAISISLTGEKPYDIAQDILVREAIGYAIDRQAIINAVFDGFASDSQTLVPPDLLGQSVDEIRGYTYDPERAQALLEEAGWQDTDGDGIREKGERELRLEIISGFPDGPDNRQTPEILQTQFRKVGIELKITSVPDVLSYETLLADKRGDLWLEIGNQNSASPCFNPRYLYYGRDANPNIYQLAYAPRSIGWSVFDDEIDNCSIASTSSEAALHAAKAMHILVDQVRAVIPLVGLYQIWFTSDEIQNFEPHPIFVMVRWDTVRVIR